jgi:hypothetical protein
MPDLARLAEEVRESRTPRVLLRGDEVIAKIVPASPRPVMPPPGRKREKAKEDEEAFLSSAGSWNGIVDTDQLKKHIAESRALSSRPPIEL